jgi:hypothetical protein
MRRVFRLAALAVAVAALARFLARHRGPRTRGSVTTLPRGARAGSIERCGIHGIAFDIDTEACPACAQEGI